MQKELDKKTQEHIKQIEALQQVSTQKSKEDKDRLQAEKSALEKRLTDLEGKKTSWDKVKVLEDANITLTEDQKKKEEEAKKKQMDEVKLLKEEKERKETELSNARAKLEKYGNLTDQVEQMRSDQKKLKTKVTTLQNELNKKPGN